VLEPEYATVGAAQMSAAPKKTPLLHTVFHVGSPSRHEQDHRPRAGSDLLEELQ